MLNNYKGNSAHLKALKLARIEQHIADGVVYLSLSLGVVALFTFLNWAMLASLRSIKQCDRLKN